MREKILITNDDGINSKGLRALIEVASQFGDVTVIAPERGMSGMSHSITISEPLYIRRIWQKGNVCVLACDGTPVDCVKVAIDYIMEEKPTLVLSGVNHGSNSNISVIYSGTMGAAREGALCNVPSIGFSLTSHDVTADLRATKKIIKDVLDRLIPYSKHQNMCLNVNIPNIAYEDIKGIKFCRQTMGYWRETFDCRVTPQGREYLWMNGQLISEDTGDRSTDEWALRNNYVAIVPIIIDHTDYNTLATFSENIIF